MGGGSPVARSLGTRGVQSSVSRRRGRGEARAGGRTPPAASKSSRRSDAGRRRGRSGSVGRRRAKPVVGLGGEQVEGRRAVRELLLAGRRGTRTVVVCRGAESSPAVDRIMSLAREQKTRVKLVGRGEFDSSARTASPQGVIAYADPIPVIGLVELLEAPGVDRLTAVRSQDSRSARGVGHASQRARGPTADGTPVSRPFLLVLDGITDPGNLGAVLRTAECAGVTGVVMRGHRAARITPAAAKAAAGAIEHLRMAVVPGLPAALRILGENRVWTVGLDPAGEQPVHEIGLADDAIALVLGAEGRGLSRLVAKRCDMLASIPMCGALGSLNVSAAAAVACFEIARHRRSGSDVG